MKKILPVTQPLFSGYPATGYILSVLQSYTITENWLYNNFVQLFSASDNDIDFFDICIENCPFIDYNYVDKELVFRRFSLIDFIINMIDMGFYISFFVDTSFISVYDFKSLHDPMIYGYDLNKEELYIADHFVNGKFSFAHCSFSEMKSAVKNNNFKIDDNRFLRNYKVFTFFRFDDSLYKYRVHLGVDQINKFQFSIDRFRESLNDYIECRPTINWYTRIPYLSKIEEMEHYFGLDCYDLLMKHISWTWDMKTVYRGTRQSLYVEYSHKLMMIKRIQYLGGVGVLKNYEIHEYIYRKILQDSWAILMSYIKNVIKQSYKLEEEEKICQKLIELKKYEYIEVKRMLADI